MSSYGLGGVLPQSQSPKRKQGAFFHIEYYFPLQILEPRFKPGPLQTEPNVASNKQILKMRPACTNSVEAVIQEETWPSNEAKLLMEQDFFNSDSLGEDSSVNPQFIAENKLLSAAPPTTLSLGSLSN